MAVGYNWVCPACTAVNVAKADFCDKCRYDARSLSARIGLVRAFGLTVAGVASIIALGSGYFLVRVFPWFASYWYLGIVLFACGLLSFGIAAWLRRPKRPLTCVRADAP